MHQNPSGTASEPHPLGSSATAPEHPSPSQSPRGEWLLPLALFLLTLLTTFAVGSRLARNFHEGRPAFSIQRDWNPFAGLWGDPSLLLLGLPFAVTLLGVLLAHELGHFFTCRHYRIDASYPYFIPAPTMLGTMGAFIRIRSAIVTRRALFDVGISGPLVGFALALPVLVYGIAHSKVIPAMHSGGAVYLGNPPLVLLLEGLFFPGISPANIYLHPIARAGWVGLFATALNLLPVGQLDGGHILYSVWGKRHRAISLAVALALIAVGVIPGMWQGWTLWGLLLLVLGLRHPSVMDPAPLGAARRGMAGVALLLLLLCFTPVPFEVL